MRHQEKRIKGDGTQRQSIQEKEEGRHALALLVNITCEIPRICSARQMSRTPSESERLRKGKRGDRRREKKGEIKAAASEK